MISVMLPVSRSLVKSARLTGSRQEKVDGAADTLTGEQLGPDSLCIAIETNNIEKMLLSLLI
jgi:hypothetical protein